MPEDNKEGIGNLCKKHRRVQKSNVSKIWPKSRKYQYKYSMRISGLHGYFKLNYNSKSKITKLSVSLWFIRFFLFYLKYYGNYSENQKLIPIYCRYWLGMKCFEMVVFVNFSVAVRFAVKTNVQNRQNITYLK